MSVICLFIVLRLVSKSLCDGTDDKLDISNCPRSIHHVRSEDGSVVTDIYAFGDNKNVVEVVDGDMNLWKRDDTNEKCIGIVVHSSGRRGVAYVDIDVFDEKKRKYYGKNLIGNQWISVNSNLYFNLFFNLIHERVFDIAAVDDTMIRLHKSTPFGNSITVYNTLFRYNIIKVVEGDNVIWDLVDPIDSTLTQYCSRIIVQLRNDMAVLTSIELVDDDSISRKYYKKFDGQWKQVSRGEYKRTIEVLINECSVDISKIEADENITRAKYHPYGIDAVILTPKYGKIVKEIKDGGYKIWSAKFNTEECCVSGTIYYYEGEIVLCQLLIDSVNEYGFNYYRRESGVWNICSHQSFYDTLGEFDNSMDETT